MVEEDYSRLLVKQYTYWGVYVYENQSYLGRCVVWCDRKDALELTDVTDDEYAELLTVLKELRVASQKAFGGDWFNYASLGNGVRHLHIHFIPRYSTDKEFEGVTFKDTRWGHSYQTDHSFVTPPDVREEIRKRMQKALG